MRRSAGARLLSMTATALLMIGTSACGSQPEAPADPSPSSVPTVTRNSPSGPSFTPPTPTGQPPASTPVPRGTRKSPSGTGSAPVSATSPPASTGVPTGTRESPSEAGPATPTPTGPPPASTPVPQPVPGDVSATVSTGPEQTGRPVALDSPADAGDGLKASITRVRGINAKAEGPGEVSGPALALTVSVENGSRRPADLGATAVTLEDSEGAPAAEILSPPAKPLAGTLASGKTATGTYVFRVANDRRDPIRVLVTLGSGLPVLVFRGDAG